MSLWGQRGVGFLVVPAALAFPRGPGLVLQSAVAVLPGLVPRHTGQGPVPMWQCGVPLGHGEGQSRVQSTAAWPVSVHTLPRQRVACPRVKVLQAWPL